MVKPVRTILLTRSEVEGLLDMPSCIDAVERAFHARASGEVVRTGVLGIHGDGGGFHAKVALAESGGSTGYFAAKLNANFPGNPLARGLPTIQGVLALFDASNGVPLAVMDSIGITVLRTAAATAVATRHLALPDASTATIIGCGAQALAQLTAVHAVRPLTRVYAFDVEPRAAAAFAEAAAKHLGISVEVPADLRTATRASQMIVTVTPARRAFLSAEHVSAGTFIAAVGADSEEKQEIEAAFMAQAAVVVDDLQQCATIGDLHHAIAGGLMGREDVRATLAEVALDPPRGRRDAQEIVVFDSTGVALEDVAAASFVYERAIAAGGVQELAFGE